MEVKVTEAQLFEKIGRLTVECQMRSEREEQFTTIIRQQNERIAQLEAPEETEDEPVRKRNSR